MPVRAQHTQVARQGAWRLCLLIHAKNIAAVALGAGLVCLSYSALAESVIEEGTGRLVSQRAWKIQGETLSQEQLSQVRGRYARAQAAAIDESLGVILWDEGRPVRKVQESGTSRHQESSSYKNHQSKTVITRSQR